MRTLINASYVVSVVLVALLVLSSTWLLFRVLSLLTKPRKDLEAALGIARQASFNVVIEELGSSHIEVHILNCPKKRLVLRVGGQVVETERGQDRAVIRQLEPDTDYKLEVQLLRGNARDAGSSYGLSSSSGAGSGSGSGPSSGPGMGSGSGSSLGSSNSIIRVNFHTLTVEEASGESMTTRLGKSRERELQRQAEAGMADERKQVQDQLNSIWERRKIEEGKHLALRAELKLFEDHKHALELQRSKLAKRTKDLVDHREAQEQRHSQLQSSLVILTSQLDRTQAEMETRCKSLVTDHDLLLNDLVQLRESFNDSQSQLKVARDLVAQAKSATDRLRPAEATQSMLVSEVLELLEPVNSSLTQILRQEIEQEVIIDKNWYKRQAELENSYITAYQKYETASRALERETSQAQARAHAQAKAQAKMFASSQQSLKSLQSLTSSITSHDSLAPSESPTSRPSMTGSLRLLPHSPNLATNHLPQFSQHTIAHTFSREHHDLSDNQDQPIISPISGGLLPSNLFQDGDEEFIAASKPVSQDFDHSFSYSHRSTGSYAGSFNGSYQGSLNSIGASPTGISLSSSLLAGASLSPQGPSTPSLVPGSSPIWNNSPPYTGEQLAWQSPPEMSSIDQVVSGGGDGDDPNEKEPDTPTKMLRKGLGRGLFHLDSKTKGGNFVRRLSLFSRARDASPTVTNVVPVAANSNLATPEE